LVDEVLRAESDFAGMDFATRDRYRHAVEELARGSGHAELEVARRAVLAAKRAGPAGDGATRREQDPGYYLIARGRRAFEKDLGSRPPIKAWVPRAYGATGILGYLGTIVLVQALALVASWW